MERQIKAVVLAAGKSKRMKSDFTKMAHKILGKTVINYLLDSLVECGLAEEDIALVVGGNEDEIRRVVSRNVQYARQEEQLGTAHALLSARRVMENYEGDLLVTVGDNPYINSVELKKLIAEHRESRAHCSFISAVFPHKPPPYGRVIRDIDGVVTGVVEEIDASPNQLKLREVNSSIYLFDNAVTYPLLDLIGNDNAKGEYYLTDIIQILKDRGFHIHGAKTENYVISIGINNKWELQQAQQRFNRENLVRLAVEEGVIFLQPESTTVEYDVEIGRDTVIYPGTYIAAGTRIGSHCRIGPHTYLRGVTIKDRDQVVMERREG